MKKKSKTKQAVAQQMGGKGNLKRAPKKMANGRKSAGKDPC